LGQQPREGVNDMTNIVSEPRLDNIREVIREPLRLLADRLQVGLPGNLESITVVGSSLTDDFRPGASDINTVVVLREHSLDSLNLLASLARPLRKNRLAPPLLVTPRYIERSRDVFGIEFLDFQLIHQTILGADPFASLTFEKHNVRLQCERELKATLVRLRQGYIAARGNWRPVRDILIETTRGLAPLARAMLWLRDIGRPKTMAASLHKAAEQFQVNLDAPTTAHRWRHENPVLTRADMERVFEAMFASVGRLAEIVDGLEL
jgi:hypothetical protein